VAGSTQVWASEELTSVTLAPRASGGIARGATSDVYSPAGRTDGEQCDGLASQSAPSGLGEHVSAAALRGRPAVREWIEYTHATRREST
jgi:hypothetical protein